ncbi:MAG: tRNA modification GTPase [Planctomycetota bacterium]|jgi:tRNA modification GTPase
MYQLNDTIVAVSSPTSEQRVIVRISGPDTIEVLRRIFRPSTTLPIADCRFAIEVQKTKISNRKSIVVPGSAAISAGHLTVDPELRIDAKLYLFSGPHSYTGDEMGEIHICANLAVTGALMSNLLGKGLRTAGPGEFTTRAYLNGKMDLTQAEAVNEIIVSSNRFQLAASEKLLAGRLTQTTAKVDADIMDCLSLIEAGLDFSGEDIELQSEDRRQKAELRHLTSVLCCLSSVRNELERLLSGSISYEEVVDLPAVGIAGAPNAGKSSLLNKMLGKARSIVSEQRKTTRDVLTGLLALKHCKCVLFDCAGLTESPKNILDELAQQAAIEALQNSSLVIFCVDISKDHWAEDLSIRQLVEPEILIPVATKSDLLSEQLLAKRLSELNELFAGQFLSTSAKTGAGLEPLRDIIDAKLIEGSHFANRRKMGPEKFEIPPTSGVALTARHRQGVVEAIENVSESISELKAGNDEIAALMLRAACQSLSTIEQQNIDERILERIFSRFCIGK